MEENNNSQVQPQNTGHAMKPSNNKTKNILIAVIVVLSIGILALAGYGYTKIKSDNKKINDLNSQVTDLQNTKKNLETAIAEAAKVVASQVVAKVTTPTDVAQVNTLAKNQVEAEVGVVAGKNVTLSTATICTNNQFATVKRNNETMAFKKVNGSWVYLFGFQNINQDDISKWGLPTNFCTGQ